MKTQSRSQNYHIAGDTWQSSVDEGSSLLSAAFTLQPKTFYQNRYIGRALHAEVIKALGWSSEVLRASLIEESDAKPYTVSDIVELDGQLTFRVTALNAAVSHALARAFGDWQLDFTPDPRSPCPPLSSGADLELSRIPFRITSVRTRSESHLLAGQSTYGGLALPWIYQQYQPADRIRFDFITPAFFKSNNVMQYFPQPDWVFGSLADRWSAFCPKPFPAIPFDVRKVSQEHWYVENFNLKTVTGEGRTKVPEKGVVGHAIFAAKGLKEQELCVFNLLAEYAFFCGVGKQTTMGFGMCLTSAA